MIPGADDGTAKPMGAGAVDVRDEVAKMIDGNDDTGHLLTQVSRIVPQLKNQPQQKNRPQQKNPLLRNQPRSNFSI